MKFANPTHLRSLSQLDFHCQNVHYQLEPSELIQKSLVRNEGVLNNTGALVIQTGKFTGRSPKDKFIVFDPEIKNIIDWNEFNNPIDPRYFDHILKQTVDFLNNQEEIFVRDAYACADPNFQMSFRIINQTPAMNLFAYNMLIRSKGPVNLDGPDWHIITAPGLELNALQSGTRQSNATIVNFSKRVVLIIGSGYTGEIKKSIFSVLNYYLPTHKKVLSMHCAANESEDGSTTLFFGLSGTGKTTLSTDPLRKLIGDDEHGWSDNGIFNFEGGCYAKCIHLSKEKEPEIFDAIRPGALVENTCFYANSDRINFNDASVTENTRVSYPLTHIENRVEAAIGGIPGNIIFLTCDAFGVLPPVSRLTKQQAIYYFLNGYTAKIAGTEAGIIEPKPTFSACFGAPFMPLHPKVYAKMLDEKINKHNVKVWMINTGWVAGKYGEGYRIPLSYSRAIINAILGDQLDHVNYAEESIFHLNIPEKCPGLPGELLVPRNAWADKEAYYMQANDLKKLFEKNYSKFFDSSPIRGEFILLEDLPG